MAAILLLGSCVGCVIVPIAQKGHKVTLQWRDRMLELAKTRPTRAEVIEELGKPRFSPNDLPVVGYQWSGVEWEVFAVGATSERPEDPWWGGSHAPVVDRVLWIGFDDADRMSQWEITVRSAGKTTWEQAFDWSVDRGLPMSKAPSLRFVATPPPADQAIVHLFWKRSNEDSPIIGIRVDGQERTQIGRGRWTTVLLGPGVHRFSIEELPFDPFDLELAAGQVRYLEFHPARQGSERQAAFRERGEEEALVELKPLNYCR